MLPNVSTELNLLIKTLFFNIFLTPKARLIVTTAGKPSGIELISCPLTTPENNIITAIRTTATPNLLPSLFSFFCKGVNSSSSCIILAIFPTSVFIPVLTTTAFPFPSTIVVPEKTIFPLLPTSFSPEIEATSLSTGVDSPVNKDSSVFNS